MPYSIVVAGGQVYSVSSSGTATALSLPTGITIDSTRPARMTVLGRQVIIVNAPNRSIWVDAKGVIRPLMLRPPTGSPVLAAGAAGGYTGAVKAKYTNIIKDPDTNALLMESDYSDVSAARTVTAQLIAASGAQVCLDSQATHRRFYRTQNGPGAVYFEWLDLDGNTRTSFADDLPDAALGLFAAPDELGSAPGMVPGTRMTLITEWKGRLFGVGDVDVDVLRYSGADSFYGWPADYAESIQPVGNDIYGITGLIRRRDELGICKRNIIWKITGKDPASFEPLRVIEGKGCYGPDSIVVVRDIGYFLGEDGVYTWGPDGVQCISDERVRGWFATDTYFNRSQFPNAVGHYNARYHSYELQLSAAGSTALDRWVVYDIARKEWFGPHLTAGFTPSWGSSIVDANALTIPIIGTVDGYLMRQNRTNLNDNGSAIAIDWISKAHNADAPDDTKIFNDLSLLQAQQAAAGGLQIGVALGDYNAAVTKTLTADGRKTRQRFSNLGPARNVRLEFTDATLNQGVELHGYEIPWGLLGRR